MTPPPLLRIGVIGLGQIAVKAHLPGYAKAAGCRLEALYSSRESFARGLAVQYGIPTVYKDWRKLLASPRIDAVSICTPNFTHAPIALEALKRGKHVLVEKPIAISMVQARAMVREARRRKRILMAHHNMRFDPAVRTAQKVIARGDLGRVFAFAASLAHRGPQAWSPSSKWFFNPREAGGGVLMDLGAHMFDSLDFLLGEPIVDIQASSPVPTPAGGAEVHCACLLRSKDGAVGTLTLSWVDTDYHNRFYFFGTKGTLFLNLGVGEPLVLELRQKSRRVFPPLTKDVFKPSIYQHFVDCVRLHQKPRLTAEDGIRALSVIQAGYRSLREGRPVPLKGTA